MWTLYYIMKSRNKSKLSTIDYYRNIDNNRNNRVIKRNENISNKCRVCLQEGSMPIFGTEDTEFIIEALAAIANITVTDNEKHPRYLCDVCHEFIKGALLFRKIARESEEIMKQVMKQATVDEPKYNRDPQDCSSLHDRKQSENWKNKELIKMKAEATNIKYVSKVTCNICNKVLKGSSFKEHMTMHDPNHKKYVCEVCGKSFRMGCSYYNHRLRHRNDFPYKCTLCPYKGRYSALLKTHLRTHAKDYKYMCTVCPARFTTSSNLNRHASRHKEPTFKCDTCQRGFHSKLVLQRHFETNHLGIKNHICNICGKAFGYRKGMMKHQLDVHKREKKIQGRPPSYIQAEKKLDDSI